MSIPLIGSLVAASVATPSTVDGAGFAALTWTTINGVTAWAKSGDTSSDILIDQLSGRILHRNGGLDGGEREFAFMHINGDAGQNILRNNSNNNTTVSIRITEPDGQITYYHGLIANVQDAERTNKTYKGFTGVVRVNSSVVRV